MAEYLEREALLRELRLWHMHKTDSLPDHFHYTGIKAWLEALPAEDVQPVKHGRWEEIDVQDVKNCTNLPITEITSMRCNKCNRYHNEVYFYGNPTENALYCPHCGARMDGEDNA